jgi:hypothetical protein
MTTARLAAVVVTAVTYRSIEQLAAAVEASGRPAIVIGVQGARAGDTDPEWRNWGPGRNWETATAKELVAVVDARYRTIASRARRVLIGISAGEYGATLIALHNPGVYSRRRVVERVLPRHDAGRNGGARPRLLRRERLGERAQADSRSEALPHELQHPHVLRVLRRHRRRALP